ncbi:amidohydrolase [Bacillus sp. 03113]|uniref:amidohydrolase n=1 Tax=Bacillus sp. 03113 TaxID=2578211 RepID=UPI00114200D5
MGTLWYGGNIYTLQEEGHQVEAVFTEGQKIIDIGALQALEEKYYERITKRIDLKEDTMLPGFVDSHLHIIGHGEKLIRLDLSSYTTKQAMLSAVRDYANQLSEGAWVIGDGWNENLWEQSLPITRDEIDQYVSNRPVLLKRICHHVCSLNSKAIEAAGLSDAVQTPAGGEIEKDQNGRLNGLFKEQAMELAYQALPELTNEYVESALKKSIQDAYRLGLTGGHTEDLSYYKSFKDTYETFKKVIIEEQYPFRLHLLVHHEVFEDFKDAGGKFQAGNEWIEFGAMKIFSDGALGGRTALLSRPYADDPSTSGVAIFSQEQLNELVKKAREIDMPVAIHAIGDLAFEMSLNAIETYPYQGKGRDRLIHGQILRKDLVERVKKLPMIIDIQPMFVLSDFPWVIDRIGEDYLEYCYAWKTMLKEGIHIAGGSDAPVEPLDPLLGIQAAVTRTKVEDPMQQYIPSESLSIYEAVCLFTKGSAYAAGHELERGQIKKGYYGDFTVLKQDPFSVEKSEIYKIGISKTIIGCQIVYDARD